MAESLTARARVAGGVGHSSTTGELREQLVRSFLRPHMPRTLEVRSGVIIDSLGNRSLQQDCVIVDTRFPLIDVGSDTQALLIAESVVATVEVKSRLDRGRLRSTLESVRQTKALSRSGQHTYRKGPAKVVIVKPMPILGYVFAYDGTGIEELGRSAAAFAHECKDPYVLPEAICVLSKGVVTRPGFRPTVSGNQVILPPITDLELDIRPYTRDALLAFYRRLIDDIGPLQLINVDYDAYYSADELE